VRRKRFYVEAKIAGRWIRVDSHYYVDSALSNAEANYVSVKFASGKRVFTGVRVIYGGVTLIRWKEGYRT
jgi:hypothetical protein